MMGEALRLMLVLAHPDDESLGAGGLIARYAAEGVEVTLVMATRGERGWFGDAAEYPGPTALGRAREAELAAAAAVLGIREVVYLDYIDGELDQADAGEAIGQVVGHVRRVRPQVVMTFGPDGAYGHPDHVAISQMATAAVVRAADGGYAGDGRPAHRVAKLYYHVGTEADNAAYEAVFGALVMTVDGVARRTVGRPAWVQTTIIDTAAYWETVWRAVACHRTQLVAYDQLLALPTEQLQALWASMGVYRVYSLVNGGRQVERDVFEGLR